MKPTDQRRARDARQSTRLRDQRVLTVLPTTRTPRARASGGEVERTEDRTSHEWDGRNPVRNQGRCPLAIPCRLNDENSREKMQNVRGDITAISEAIGGTLLILS